MTTRYEAVKGFHDLMPPDTKMWEKAEQAARDIFSLYGFLEIRPPVLEYTELFARSIGQDTDIVEKEMFTFSDKKGRSLTLRPEATASVVRAYIQHNLGQHGPVKLYYIGPMFRYERPQKGRQRQFWQIGAETIGMKGPASDAELMAMLKQFFDKLEIKGLSLEINSLGCSKCRQAYGEELVRFLKARKSDLCEDCSRRLEVNPLRVLDCKNEQCQRAISDAPAAVQFLCKDCKAHFSGLKRYLDIMQVEYTENPRIVRGLDYYTRTVFEYLAADSLGAQNAVAAGGRYDDLIKDLGGHPTPAAGFALGMERLIMLIPQGKEPSIKEKILIAAIGEDALEQGLNWAKMFRESGHIAEISEETKSLKKQLKTADRMKASHVLIIGEDEIKRRIITIRDMASSEQKKYGANRFKQELSKREWKSFKGFLQKLVPISEDYQE